MDIMSHYDAINTPLRKPMEILEFAEGCWQLRQALILWDEGLGRVYADHDNRVYNEIEEELDRALLQLPHLILKGADELIRMHYDELVSRAANIFAERWLHEKYRYNYSDLQDLEWDLIDVCLQIGTGLKLKSKV